MPEVLTESFCERCGTRYEFAAPTRLNPLRKTRGFVSGLRNYIMSQDALGDAMSEAMRSEEDALATAQLDAFHESFNFCIGCRQYTCLNCWNDAAGRCTGCAPVAVAEEFLALATPTAAGNGSTPHVGEMPIAAGDHSHVGNDEAWPAADLDAVRGEAVDLPWPAVEPAAPREESTLEADVPAASLPEAAPSLVDETMPPAETELEREPAPFVADAEPAREPAEAEPLEARTEDAPAPRGEPVAGVSEWRDAPEPADVLTGEAEVRGEDERQRDVPADAEEAPALRVLAWEEDETPVTPALEQEQDATTALGSELTSEPSYEPMQPSAIEEAVPEPMAVEPASPPVPVVTPVSEPPVELEPSAPSTHLPAPPQAAESRPLAAEPMPLAAERDDPDMAARRAKLDLLGIGDPGEGVVSEAPTVLPYRSRGAGQHPGEDARLAAMARSSFWEASARQVADATTGIGVQSCGACGLSLSASARFCRRCGTRQAQSA